MKIERILKKNRCSTDFCITPVLRDVSIAVLLHFISDAGLLDRGTEKVGRKMSLVQPCATCVPHVIKGSSCHNCPYCYVCMIKIAGGSTGWLDSHQKNIFKLFLSIKENDGFQIDNGEGIFE